MECSLYGFPNEGEVDGEGLLEELGPGGGDGPLGLFPRLVLDEGVALRNKNNGKEKSALLQTGHREEQFPGLTRLALRRSRWCNGQSADATQRVGTTVADRSTLDNLLLGPPLASAVEKNEGAYLYVASLAVQVEVE